MMKLVVPLAFLTMSSCLCTTHAWSMPQAFVKGCATAATCAALLVGGGDVPAAHAHESAVQMEVHTPFLTNLVNTKQARESTLERVQDLAHSAKNFGTVDLNMHGVIKEVLAGKATVQINGQDFRVELVESSKGSVLLAVEHPAHNAAAAATTKVDLHLPSSVWELVQSPQARQATRDKAHFLIESVQDFLGPAVDVQGPTDLKSVLLDAVKGAATVQINGHEVHVQLVGVKAGTLTVQLVSPDLPVVAPPSSAVAFHAANLLTFVGPGAVQAALHVLDAVESFALPTFEQPQVDLPAFFVVEKPSWMQPVAMEKLRMSLGEFFSQRDERPTWMQPLDAEQIRMKVHEFMAQSFPPMDAEKLRLNLGQFFTQPAEQPSWMPVMEMEVLRRNLREIMTQSVPQVNAEELRMNVKNFLVAPLPVDKIGQAFDRLGASIHDALTQPKEGLGSIEVGTFHRDLSPLDAMGGGFLGLGALYSASYAKYKNDEKRAAALAQEAREVAAAKRAVALKQQELDDFEKQLEAARLQQQQEAAKKQQEMEAARIQQELEAARIQQEMEAAKKQQELETARIQREMEQARIQQKMEAAKIQQELEEARARHELEAAKLQQELEEARIRQEEEAARIEREKEEARMQREKEEARIRQEKEDARILRELEEARIQHELEAARVQQEIEAARIQQELEEATKRHEREAQEKRELEEARLLEAARQQQERDELRKKQALEEAMRQQQLKDRIIRVRRRVCGDVILPVDQFYSTTSDEVGLLG